MVTEETIIPFTAFLFERYFEVFKVFQNGLGMLPNKNTGEWDLAITQGKEYYTKEDKEKLIAAWEEFKMLI